MTTYRTGKYDYNALCDVCGFKYKASQLRKRWDGFMVCEADWEPRNILDFYRTRKDAHLLPFTRPDDTGEHTWVPVFTSAITGAYTVSASWIYNSLNNLYNCRILITPTSSITINTATVITGPTLDFTATTVVDRGGMILGVSGVRYATVAAVGTIGTVTVDVNTNLASPLTVSEKIWILCAATVT